ncbi:MAG: TonB-dependent receptor plug domain-containing protein [Gemmatimonadetes bacterium]|nr:TonB-dependent receptor plug domain-containing protein [Gemmatimonadota bacterium]
MLASLSSAAAALLGVMPGMGRAQALGIVTGTVAEAETGRPIDQVQITGINQRVSGRTDRRGAYRLVGVPAGDLIIRLDAPGFALATEQIHIGATDSTLADFELSRVGDLLSQVIRGQPGGGELGARGARPVEGEVVEPGMGDHGRRATEMLGSRVAGVRVQQGGGGQVGAGTSIQIRGAKSFIQANDPIIIVDGVRVSGGAAGGVPARGRGPTILDLLGSETIDRIEVLRGPAAGAQYGEGALNGVVLIYTKQGAGGGR